MNICLLHGQFTYYICRSNQVYCSRLQAILSLMWSNEIYRADRNLSNLFISKSIIKLNE